jgi:hypothetical protein
MGASRVLDIMRKQDQTARVIEATRDLLGDEEANVICGAYVIGVVSYLTRRYGPRKAYEAIQQIADRIPEFPRDKQ